MDPTPEDAKTSTCCIAVCFERIIQKLIEVTPKYMYFILAADG